MAVVLVALEAYALIEQVNNIYSSACERIEHACRNPVRARNLANVFEQLKTKLAPLALQCENNHVQFPDQHVEVFKHYIDDLKVTLKNIQTELEKKISKLNNRFYRISRAHSMNDWLSSIESTARDADRLVLSVTSCFANASLTAKNAIAIEGVMEAVGSLNISTDDEQDEFKPCFEEVPHNPPHVVLDFSSISDIDEGNRTTLTVEAELKRAVLRSDGSRSVAAVGSRLGVTGVKGMSGVGKSCALRGLANDVDVCGRFRDGIYFMILGKDATERDVIQNISKILSWSGSKQVAREAQVGIDEAISKARVWFKGKCILLEIDDVWEASGWLRDVVGRLSTVVDMKCGSRVVFSTRDERMAARSEVIRFGERGKDVSSKILLAAAGLTEVDVAGCEKIVGSVLEYCGGIPMALAVAGSAIKMRLAPNGILTVSDVLQEYAAGLQGCRQPLVKRTVDNDPYNNLESAFRTSLEMLEKSQEQRLGFRCEMSIVKMYRSLAIMRRQGWIPVSVLRRLWGMRDVYNAITVMQELVGASLAQREDRIVKREKVPGITLHDLQLYFVEEEVREHGELEMWHRKVLRIWLQEGEGSSSCGGLMGRTDWCNDVIFGDDYVRNNLCRHLMGGGLQDELHALLKNPEWAAKRLCGGEIISLEEDIRMLVEYMNENEGKGSETGSVTWSLSMIAGAARLSAPYVSRNASEVWFQLYGRLFHHAESSQVVKSYIADIERFAQGPWLKALMRCFLGPGGALQSKAICDGRLCSLSEMGGDGRFVACGVSAGGGTFVSTFVCGQEQRTVWLSNGDMKTESSGGRDVQSGTEEGSSSTGSSSSYSRGSREIARLSFFDTSLNDDDDNGDDVWSDSEGELFASETTSSSAIQSSEVSAISSTKDGRRVVTGHADGRVQIWDAKTGDAVGEALVGHTDGVECVAWSPDSKQVASGGYDSTVLVWEVDKMEPLGRRLVGHKSWVRCIAWSPDGKRIASGGYDGIVRFWNVENGKTVGEALVGHTEGVRCVAWSPDGKRIASGGSDCTLRVWEVGTREVVGEALVGHSDWVRCVAWSPDGKRLVSGGHDGTVRIWEVETGNVVEEGLVGHTDWVLCVSWSSDGKTIASGGRDGTLRFWGAKEKGALGGSLVKHSESVRCLAWSPNGKRIASGGDDCTVRLWDVETGKAIGEALVGHSDWVRCMAWSPDGKRIASGGDDGTVHVWEVEKGVAMGEVLVGHGGYVRCVAWSPDGKRIAAGGGDKTVRIWEVEKGEEVGDALVGHRGWVESVAWSHDGKRIASGGDDHIVRVWEVESRNSVLTEDNWVVGDLSRLNCLLDKGDMEDMLTDASALYEERRIFVADSCMYMLGGMKLGTLEDVDVVCWKYSSSCRSIALGGRAGEVYEFQLLE